MGRGGARGEGVWVSGCGEGNAGERDGWRVDGTGSGERLGEGEGTGREVVRFGGLEAQPQVGLGTANWCSGGRTALGSG